MSRPEQKTYWHLLDRKRIPSEYEIVTSRLLYYPDRGFETETPIGAWYREYQAGSALRCGNWEAFADPRETTYARYTGLQRDRETFVDRLLSAIEGTPYDAGLPPWWLYILDRVLAPLRFPCHGLQMLAAYAGSMAPSGRIVAALAFQTADEIRRIHRLAYRLRELREVRPGLGGDSKGTWAGDPMWQPLRKTLERLLVAFDWGECLAGLNLVLKPLFDELFMNHFGRLARRAGDDVMERMLQSLAEDGAWQRSWTVALVRTILHDNPESEPVLRRWIGEWRAPAMAAAGAFRPVFEELPDGPAATPYDGVLLDLSAFHREFLAEAGLGGEAS